MDGIEVLSEQEDGGGWSFRVQGPAVEDECRIRLSWADYNLWSDGSDPPARVAEAVARFLRQRGHLDQLRPAFDAAIVRRVFPDADEHIPGLLGAAGED